MERATSNEANAHYNDEILFLDGVVEFHPEVYDTLPNEEKELLQAYYLVGQPIPENIFEYRNNLLREQPDIEAKAKTAFIKLLESLDIDEFTYSTKVADSL